MPGLPGEHLHPKGRVQLLAFDAREVPTYDTLLDKVLRRNRVRAGDEWKWVPDLDTLFIEPLMRQRFPNLIVNAGLTAIANAVSPGPAFQLTFCGVGSSSTAPTVNDTDLNTSIARVAVTSPYIISPNISVWDTFFSSSAGNGTWNESGLFTASVGGTMWCHALFSSTFTKASTNTAVVEWKTTF